MASEEQMEDLHDKIDALNARIKIMQEATKDRKVVLWDMHEENCSLRRRMIALEEIWREKIGGE